MKNKYNVTMLIAVALLPILSACAPEYAVDMRTFEPFVDESVGCDAYPPTLNDIVMQRGSDDSVFFGANSHGVPGLFMGSIAAINGIPFRDNSIYTLSGEFRKFGIYAEQVDANLQLIENFVEYRAEIIWYLNPYRADYGDVAIRLDGDEPISKYHLGDDDEWHTFTITTVYKSNPKIRVYKSFSIDGLVFDVNEDAGTLRKDYKENFAILLEVQNRNTNCDPENVSAAFSDWRNIKLERVDIQ